MLSRTPVSCGLVRRNRNVDVPVLSSMAEQLTEQHASQRRREPKEQGLEDCTCSIGCRSIFLEGCKRSCFPLRTPIMYLHLPNAPRAALHLGPAHNPLSQPPLPQPFLCRSATSPTRRWFAASPWRRTESSCTWRWRSAGACCGMCCVLDSHQLDVFWHIGGAWTDGALPPPLPVMLPCPPLKHPPPLRTQVHAVGLPVAARGPGAVRGPR